MPDPFALQIAFTGIVTLVPDRAFNDQPKRLCFLLVDGRSADVGGTRVPAVDQLHNLDRHVGFITLDAKHLQDSALPIEGTKLVWYLDRQRLNFNLTHQNPAHQKQVNVMAKLSGSTLLNVCDLGTIAGGFGNVDPTVVDRNPPRTDLLAQIVVDDGNLDVAEIDPELWEFPDSVPLGSLPPQQNLAHEMTVTVPDLTAASILVTPFGGSAVSIDLQPAGEDTIRIDVSNLCDLNPLNWPRTDTHANTRPRPDVDFKWHYQLLAPTGDGSREQLRQRLQQPPPPLPGGRPVPHPRPVPAAPGVNGENCFGSTMSPTPLDGLDP